MEYKYKKAISCCKLGYAIESVIDNYLPLLIMIFQNTYGINMRDATTLITISFGIRIPVNLLATFFLNNLGSNKGIMIAHGLASCGLVLMALLPDLLQSPMTGLLIAVVTYAIGGALLESTLGDIVTECCNGDSGRQMAAVQAFYCWGTIAVVLIATVVFGLFSDSAWRILATAFALLPLWNMTRLRRAVIPGVTASKNAFGRKPEYFNIFFVVLLVMMLCAGASERSISQWAATFAENAMPSNTTLANLMGPLMFAALMGLGRTFYGVYGNKVQLRLYMILSAVLGVAAHCIMAFSTVPACALIGCAVSGFAVGVFWPGCMSIAGNQYASGGASMLALLIAAGNIGSTIGPFLVGIVSAMTNNDIQIGVLSAVIFPSALLICLLLMNRLKKA